MRNELYTIKALAIFCVVCAHCTTVGSDAPAVAQYSSFLLQQFGTLGVSCFFLLSGALFYSRSLASFWKKKAIRLLLPWLISATCVYLYVALRKSPITWPAYAHFILGQGSYCYYMTVLLLCYCLYAFPICRKPAVLLASMLFTAASVFFFPSPFGLSPYLNPANWIGFFALGLWCRQNAGLAEKGFNGLFRFRALIYLGYGVYLVYALVTRSPASYFGFAGIVSSLLGGTSLILLGTALSRRFQPKILDGLGRESYFIYLWHMPLAGIAARLIPAFFVLFRPMIVLALMESCLLILHGFRKRKFYPALCALLGLSTHSFSAN